MSVITTASRQWATRPDDERFTSLYAMRNHFDHIRNQSRSVIVPTRRLSAVPTDDNRGIELHGPNGVGYAPTHWAFSQLANVAGAPAGYLRTLPAPIAADALNYGLQFGTESGSENQVLLQKNGESICRAVTGPRYGRIWNNDVVSALANTVGDGVTGRFKVPGEFGRAVEVTKANTTLYASDRDFFVFLADEENRIPVANRRDGKSGSLARGFFVWNSEVGAQTFGIATFLFDYVCSNRMVWGAQEHKEIKIRHTVSAPDRFLDEIRPALLSYANASSRSVTEAITEAQNKRMGDKLDDFLAARFGKRMVAPLRRIHMVEENRPIETLWDVTVAATAFAKSIPYQDERVAMERDAGKILDLVAN